MFLGIEFFVVLILIIFQSIFGVGLLLFGTPIFLFMGNSFESTLLVLLPVSVTISFLQMISRKQSIKPFISEYNIFCLPFLILFLLIVLNLDEIIDIKIYVAIFLIISALIALNKNKITFFNDHLIKYRKLCLAIIGTIHGFTNMGGGFLSIFSGVVNGNNREMTRNYISYGYFTMGIIQYITILLVGTSSIDFNKLYYLILPLIFFFPAQKIFKNINNIIFIKIINYIALLFGIIALLLIINK